MKNLTETRKNPFSAQKKHNHTENEAERTVSLKKIIRVRLSAITVRSEHTHG